MRKLRKLGSFATALACVNFLVPLQQLPAADPPTVISVAAPSPAAPPLSPAAPAAARSVTRDVALSPAGELRGTLVDESGKPLANRVVVAVHSDKSIREAISDANGCFHFAGGKPGMYQIGSERSYQVCRCWAANTAPPAASTGLLLVEGEQMSRGQHPLGEVLCGPVLIGLIIAAAIIIPIAVHNTQKSAS